MHGRKCHLVPKRHECNRKLQVCKADFSWTKKVVQLLFKWVFKYGSFKDAAKVQGTTHTHARLRFSPEVIELDNFSALQHGVFLMWELGPDLQGLFGSSSEGAREWSGRKKAKTSQHSFFCPGLLLRELGRFCENTKITIFLKFALHLKALENCWSEVSGSRITSAQNPFSSTSAIGKKLKNFKCFHF